MSVLELIKSCEVRSTTPRDEKGTGNIETKTPKIKTEVQLENEDLSENEDLLENEDARERERPIRKQRPTRKTYDYCFGAHLL